jgi:hypothetical protein
MEHRIVRYRNGRFGIQHKWLFMWWDEHAPEDIPAIVTFPTYEDARKYLDRKSNGEFDVMEVIKEA